MNFEGPQPSDRPDGTILKTQSMPRTHAGQQNEKILSALASHFSIVYPVKLSDIVPQRNAHMVKLLSCRYVTSHFASNILYDLRTNRLKIRFILSTHCCETAESYLR
jgi:hypothetical protein